MILTDIVNPTMSILNASTTYGVLDDAKKFPQTFLNETAVAASDEVCDAICSTQDHPLRDEFAQNTITVANQGIVLLAGYTIYDVLDVKVDGKVARHQPATYIERMINDPLGRTTHDPMYDLLGKKLIHNGATAICRVVAFKKVAGAPQAPDQLLQAVIACHLKRCQVKAGVNIDAAGFFEAQAARALQAIRSGAVSVPDAIAWEKGVGRS